jgi:hypothetical protein
MTARRIVRFANSAVAIDHVGARAAAIVEFLFRHASSEGAAQPHVTFRLAPDGEPPDHLRLHRDETRIYSGGSDAECADCLMGDSTHHLAEASHGGLLFHAGGLAWHAHGILLPGSIGAGKTTLTAWLVMRGLDLLTDELVFVPDGAGTCQSLTRPLNIKKPSRAVLQRYFDFDAHAADILSTPYTDLVPHTLLRPNNVQSQPPLRLVLLPRYTPDGDFELRPLTRAQAGLALMECLVNARNLPEHGLSEIARLARLAPAFKLCYSHLDQLDAPVKALLSSLDLRTAQNRVE